MRATRSSTRLSIGTEGSREVCALAPVASIAATTRRHPATLTAIPLPLPLFGPRGSGRHQPTRRGGTVKPQDLRRSDDEPSNSPDGAEALILRELRNGRQRDSPAQP